MPATNGGAMQAHALFLSILVLALQRLGARLRTGPPHGVLGVSVVRGHNATRPVCPGHVCGAAWIVEPAPQSGYKVIFVPFAAGKPAGAPVDVLTGFLSPEGTAYGRPVGVALDRAGALLVTDDVGNVVWRVRREP